MEKVKETLKSKKFWGGILAIASGCLVGSYGVGEAIVQAVTLAFAG